MEKMKKSEMAEVIKELMTQFDAKRAKWIELNGSEEGFNDWFTGQVFRK